jgi:hypothetical protein
VIVLLAAACLAAPDAPAEPRLDLGARLYGRMVATDDDPSTTLSVARARLYVDLQPAPWLAAQLDMDVSEVPAIKDAYVEATWAPWLRLTVGQMKKPFSRVELLSSGKLPLVRRGLVDDRIVRKFGYGGRDQGAILGGEAGIFGWWLGVSNGTKTLPEVDDGKDAALRLVAKPARALEVGVSASMLHRTPETEPAESWYAAGVDARVRAGPIDASVEVIWAEEPSEARRQQLGALAYAVVKAGRVQGVAVRPVAKLELLDDNVRHPDNHALAASLGVNLHFADFFRVMLEAEQVSPRANSTELAERRFTAQLALDWKAGLALQRERPAAAPATPGAED